MQYGERAARAANAARSVLGRMSALDQAQIVAFDAEAQVLGPATSDRGALQALVATELRPGAGSTSYAAALSALEKLARVSSLPVAGFLITDAQKSGRSGGVETPRLPAGGTLEWIAVDDAARDNWAVSDLRVAHDTYQARYPRRMQARVNGYAKDAAKREVVFSLNGREVERRAVNLPAGGAATVVFERFDLPPGVSRGEIRLLPGDQLPQDDVRYFAIVRHEPNRLLYVAPPDGQRSLVYLRQALAAGEDPAFVIEARTPAEQGARSLNEFAAVILANVAEVPASLANQLKEYVANGGGALLLLGERSDFAALGRSLGPLLPGTSGEKSYVRREGEQFLTLGEFQRDHAIFQPFAGPAAGGLVSARFFGYFKLGLPKDGDHVLARFSNGDPALMERAAQRGRVLLLASSPDNVWSDLPIRPGFVPLVAQSARYLAQMRDEPASYSVPATVGLASGGAAATAILKPDGKRLLADSGYVRLTDTGFYEVRRPRSIEYLAANVDPRESDLTLLTAEDRELLARTVAAPPASGEPGAAPTREEMEGRQNWWWWLLGLAVALAAVESVFGNLFLQKPEEQPGYDEARYEGTQPVRPA
jgi:hypothetical protein